MASSDAASPKTLRILAVVEWYPPAFKAGGPIRSVHNLVHLLKTHTSHHLEVVCGHRDLGESEPLKGVLIDTPHDVNGLTVTYRSEVSLAWWREKLRGTDDAPAPDILYLNSLFSVPFALRPLRAARELGIRVVLAPRGMLGAGSLAIKPLKKRAFLTVARWAGWFRDVRWHASTERESADIAKAFPAQDIAIAQNAPSPRGVEKPFPTGHEMRWVCLGRIHPIKNLHFALEALREVDFEDKALTVELVGPAEDERYLEHLLSFSKPGLNVVHRGALPPNQLGMVWAEAHALLMPSTHENYGHAVVEAWSHGRPVFLSDQTPWQNLASEKLGWSLPLDQNTWRQQMSDALKWPDERWADLASACLAKHRELVEDPNLIGDNRALFERPWPSA